ncbi:flagellar biosynthesis protein FlgM [Escherichia coli]|nr:flagellar biosynthesis protein FlgM [Escherichia coli]EEU3635229.1 flagellar biosynthesis protein FlgM [Escherichia coli]EFJ2274034.1 flagellar biosynthesis protein FlgM [Escherichia coli]EFJ2770326.1 flagellar biosynthesis protein FlgM [Escherichia coli]EFM3503841.1 flagellar biosynthesis protein FlgM [Escherichia coli]
MTSSDLIQGALHRMSWSQLAKAAEESTVHHDYARALILWRHAYHAATLTINKNLATAKINFCAKRILMRNQMSKIIRHTDTDERLFRLSKHHHLYEKKKKKEG